MFIYLIELVIQIFTCIHSIYWSVALTEIAVILASNSPSLPISKVILSSLIFANGRPEHIHLSPIFLAGLFCTTLGGWIRCKCYRALGTMFTFQMTIRSNHTLVNSGPYGIVRHPGYIGAIVVFLGLCLLHGAEVSAHALSDESMNDQPSRLGLLAPREWRPGKQVGEGVHCHLCCPAVNRYPRCVAAYVQGR